jgi:hypothetical protein
MPTLPKIKIDRTLRKTIKQTNNLLKTWENEIIHNFEKTEIDLILEERLADIEAGKVQFDSWENVQKRILATMKKRVQKKN